MPTQSYLLILGLSLALLYACTPDPKSDSPGEILVHIPDSVHSKTNVTVENDMSPYPPGTNYELGRELFTTQCRVCHGISLNLTGPELGSSWEKYKSDRAFMYAFVRDGIEMIKNGDKKAMALANWGPCAMPPFPNLNDTMINSILAYAEIEAAKGTKY